MNKIKWLDLLCFFMAIFFLFSLQSSNAYDDFIKHPLENGSGTTRSRLSYLLLFKIDQYLGKAGIFIFFSILASFFLYHFIKTNLFTFSDIYKQWKERKKH